MKTRIRILSTALLLGLIAHTALVVAQATPPKPDTQPTAKDALEKMKTLAGAWKGEIMTTSITFTIRAVSSGTALLHEGHTEGGGPPNHEITMFYLDGERLLATHYCDAGNRTNMEGKMSPDGKTIKFSFLEVIGSKRGGYLKDLAITFTDADHHTLEVTFITPDAKPVPLKGVFKRTPNQDPNRKSSEVRKHDCTGSECLLHRLGLESTIGR